MAFKGGEEAEKDFGVEMIELISKTEADYVPNLETAAKDPDVKLIVGVGFLLSDALVKVAKELEDKIRNGEVEVPCVFTKEKIDYWRSILG